MRVKPLAEVCPIYDGPDSEIPEAIRIPMDNGKVLTYRLDTVDAAKQSCQTALDIIRHWRKQDEVIGYQAKHQHKKTPLELAFRSGVTQKGRVQRKKNRGYLTTDLED